MPQNVPEDRPHSDLTRSILESAMRVQSASESDSMKSPTRSVWPMPCARRGTGS